MRSHLYQYDVQRARDIFGKGAPDTELLSFCAQENLILLTHDKKDFSDLAGDAEDHAGVIIYTNSNLLSDNPGEALRRIERVLAAYSLEELQGEVVWLSHW